MTTTTMWDLQRIVIALVHFILAITLINSSLSNNTCYVKPTYYVVNGSIFPHLKNSYVIGSWVNVITSLTVIEWINASFALYYLYLPNFLDAENEENLGIHFNVLVVTVWNLIFLAITWIASGTLNIPPNNLFLYVFLVLGAIGTQNYMARAPASSKQAEERLYENERSMIAHMSTVNFFSRKTTATHLHFHERTYAHHLDTSTKGFVCRLCQGVLTGPLTLMVIAALSPGTYTWVAQSLYITLFLVFVLMILQQKSDSIALESIYMVCNATLVVLILFLFFWPNSDLLFTGTTPIPLFARILTFVVVLWFLADAGVLYAGLEYKYLHDTWDLVKMIFYVVYVAVVVMNVCSLC